MYSCSIVSDRQGLGAVVQFCTRTIAAQGMVAAVEVFQVPHGVRVDAALRKAAGALGVQAVVQDGQQAGLDGLALFFLCFDALGKAEVACQQCSADQAEEPLHPVFDDPVQHAYTSTMGMP